MFTEPTYNVIRDGSLRSATVVVPMIMDTINPQSVIDFGCGEGLWLSVFAEHGCSIIGVDNGTGVLSIPESTFVRQDLASCPDPFLPTSDLAVCLETAEHLPERRAHWLVETLCAHSQVVLFSAAIPGQGGHGHINEQWPAYWFEKFAARGYRGTGALRWRLWDRVPEVECWYAQNLFLYATEDAIATRGGTVVSPFEELFRSSLAGPVPVVHPILWDSRR